MKRWSKLQKEIYDLISPDIGFQLHCVAYPMRSQRGSTNLTRYWITIGKEIIWDYPKDFVREDGQVRNNKDPEPTCQFLTGDPEKDEMIERWWKEHSVGYPYETDVPDISVLLREYIDTPKDQLLNKNFENDKWNLTDILKASDRRIGKRNFDELKKNLTNPAAMKIIEIRNVSHLDKKSK